MVGVPKICYAPITTVRSFFQADGSNRSDAVVVFVLQKAKYAKRCYAIIADAFAKCYGSSEEAIHKPVQMHWEMMLNEFYARSNINVNDVYYVEGQGTGVKVIY